MAAMHPLVRLLCSIGDPCAGAYRWVRSLPPSTPLAVAYHTCPRVDWLQWFCVCADVDETSFGEAIVASCSCVSCAEERAHMSLPAGVEGIDAFRVVLPWPAVAQALARKFPAFRDRVLS